MTGDNNIDRRIRLTGTQAGAGDGGYTSALFTLQSFQHVFHINQMIVEDLFGYIQKPENCRIAATVVNIASLFAPHYDVL
jgi:hypothetical protein